jgi:hypothetical protein
VNDLASMPTGTTSWRVPRHQVVDGPPSGTRTLADGALLDLGEVLNMANCAKPTVCSGADMDAVTTERPWGANNPRWQLFAYQWLNDFAPTGAINSPFYVTVMVGDDPSETDGDPRRRVDEPRNRVVAGAPTRGAPRLHRAIEPVAGGQLPGSGLPAAGRALRMLSWREVRQVVAPWTRGPTM